MPLGAHLSIAGGLHKAVERAEALGCEALQIFSKSSNQWAAKPLTQEDIRAFRKALQDSPIQEVLVHDSYLINLAHPGRAEWERSIHAFREEMDRVETLGIRYLVMHPGAHLGSGEAAGLRRVVQAFDRLHRETRGYRMQVLIENTAGQGSCLGYRFEQIRAILEGVSASERMGVCLDTCHLLAGGYDMTTMEGYAETMETFEQIVGIPQVRAFHLNDSKKGLGCRVDRHEQIGKGAIGLEGFRALLRDPRFLDLPMVLETPKGASFDKVSQADAANLRVLRRLRQTRKKTVLEF